MRKNYQMRGNLMNKELKRIDEPKLKFGYNQSVLDPRDGLSLFGPYDKGNVNNFNIGLVGTIEGNERAVSWIKKVHRPIYNLESDIARPFFPGFEEVFNVTANFQSITKRTIDEKKLETYYQIVDNYQRVANIVDLYIKEITTFLESNDSKVDLWLVIIPEKIYKLCRIKSFVPKKEGDMRGIKNENTIWNKTLFETEELEELRQPYYFENHFHNQLKYKLLSIKVVTQIIRENTIAYKDFLNIKGNPKKDLSKFETAIAWNICTTLYYKLGGKPWKLNYVRDKVCYLGLVFKKDERHNDIRYACCAAQMFLDSGDGLVFKGALGPWFNPDSMEYHLTTNAANDLLTKSIESFKKENGFIPNEIFIHGRTYFDDIEWNGFLAAIEKYKTHDFEINLVGVRIVDDKRLKIFREFTFPVLRGMMLKVNDWTAYFWTRGFIPRIQSILGLETPNPLFIKIIRGKSEIELVCKDILSLTKLNYNACIFGDGFPVTLKFANKIGEILTAGPDQEIEVLPFKYYI